MQESWLKEYVLLAFRIEAAMRQHTENRFVDYYYGPPDWKAEAEAEAERSPAELVREVMALEDALARQGFEAHRATYLEKQVVSLETVCRKLNGETFSLEDEVQRCFDTRPERTPESQLERGLAVVDDVLPGDGSPLERLQAWRKRYKLAPEASSVLLGMLRRAADEARQRIQSYVPLPADEGIELQMVSDLVSIGENRYLGNYRSRVDRSSERPRRHARRAAVRLS